MLDQLQWRLATYYASYGLKQPHMSLGPLVALTGGWASSLYTFTLQSQSDSADVVTLVLKTYAPTARGREHAAREWQALARLCAVGYPVPRPSLFEPDERHIGNPFIVMEHVPGRQLWDALQQANQASQERLTREFVMRLVDLHALAPAVLAPEMRWEHPYTFIDQELRQLRHDGQRSPHVTLTEVAAWLERRKAAVPCERPAILHRDYHPWNALVDSTERLVVLDWDWSIGDARFDLAWTRTLMRRSNFHAFSGAIQEEYARQSDRSLDELAYFEVLATLRWLLNVTQSVASGAALRDEARTAFREFLIEPVQHAVALLQESTGVDVEVKL